LPAEIACWRDLPASAKMILGVIAGRIGNNDTCWPSIRRLAADTGLTKQTVLASVSRLKAKGLLEFESRGQGRANHYWLTKLGQKLYHLPNKSGQEIRPVKKSKWSKNHTIGVPEIRRQVGQKLYPNKIKEVESLNQTKEYLRPNNDALRLAELLLDLILARKPDFRKPNLQTWAKEIDKMIRLDSRTPQRIETVIRWCQGDAFWAGNILSTETLRRQFDRLEIKMSGCLKKREGIRNGTQKYDRNFASQTSSIGTAVEM
jgi:biotin operon repressor